jgi:hypothetical protein
MKKYVLILITIAVASLMVSTTAAVPQVQSESSIKIIEKANKLQDFIDEKIEEINELKQINRGLEEKIDVILTQIKIDKLIPEYGTLGPLLDWIINLINSIIAFINSIIDFISGLLTLAQLIELLISKIYQLIDLINQFIQWVIDLFSPDAKLA